MKFLDVFRRKRTRYDEEECDTPSYGTSGASKANRRIQLRFWMIAIFLSAAIFAIIILWKLGLFAYFHKENFEGITPPTYTADSAAIQATYQSWLKERVVTKIPSNEMLIAIMTASNNFRRRELMRTYQFRNAKNYNVTLKFVLGKPLDEHRNQLKQENDTYGDLIILENVPDTQVVANYIKTVYFYEYLIDNNMRYRFVAKMDTDTFVNFPALWNVWYTKEIQELEFAVIADFTVWDNVFEWAGGGFYLMSWELVEMCRYMFNKVGMQTKDEDVQTAVWLNRSGVPLVKLRISKPFQTYEWKQGYDVRPEAIRIHRIKKEKDYIMVGSCFDENGVALEKWNEWDSKGWKP